MADAALLLRSVDQVRDLVARSVQRDRCTPDDLAWELNHCPRNGSGLFRRALAEISAGARSAAEARAARDLRASRVAEFEQNVPIVDARGEVVFIVDVLWRKLRAALEIDGREYHFDRADWEDTLARHAALTAAGLSTMHLSPSAMLRDDEWLGLVDRWLRVRADELGVAYRSGPPRRRPIAIEPEPFLLARLLRPARRHAG